MAHPPAAVYPAGAKRYIRPGIQQKVPGDSISTRDHRRRRLTVSSAMFPTIVRRLAQGAKEPLAKQVPLTMANNPFKTRKVWPPNFKDLNHQQQLRFEKKYKRRILLASRSPRWEKGIKFAQLATMAGVHPFLVRPLVAYANVTAALVWLLFYSEFEWWGRQYKPSEEVSLQSRHGGQVRI